MTQKHIGAARGAARAGASGDPKATLQLIKASPPNYAYQNMCCKFIGERRDRMTANKQEACSCMSPKFVDSTSRDEAVISRDHMDMP